MEFAQLFLHQNKYKIGEVFNNSSEVLEIMNRLFSEALNDRDNKYKEFLYGLLLKMNSTPLNSRITLDSEACKNYYNHLQNNSESLTEYIKIFFRKNWDGFSDSFYIVDPYFFKIFENPQEFKDLINEQTFEDKTVQRLSKIISGIENNKFIVELPILKNGDKGYDYVHKLYSEQQNQTENEGLFKF